VSASLLLVLLLLPLLLSGMPIAAAVGLAAVASMLATDKAHLLQAAIMSVQSMNSFLLLAFPLFMLVGKIMDRGGSAQRLFRFAHGLVGWMPGGMGAVAVTSSMIFGGISGSSVADAAGLSPIQVKGMTDYGYPKSYAAALAVSASTLAVVIPPSILMVLFAVAANVSVEAMLLAGVLPGLLITLMLGLGNLFFSIRNGWNPSQPFRWKQLARDGRDGLLAAVTPAIILSAIFLGWVTATEAAALAVLWVILLSTIVFREMGVVEVAQAFRETAFESAAILFLLAGATLVSNIMTLDHVPQTMAGWIADSTMPLELVWLMLIGVLLLAGMFFDPASSIVILVPLLLPIVKALGADPVHFGVVMVVALSIGLLTPPVAPCLMAISVPIRMPVEVIFRACTPFLLLLVLSLAILAYFPQLTLWLPLTMSGR
jgi:C4-dicarboxylate transporter, DctM subunit